MTALYFVSGLIVSLILAWNSRVTQSHSIVKKNSFRVLVAITLTTLFWPAVLVMAYFDGFNTTKDRRINLGTDDLIQPVNIDSIEANNVLPQENSFANPTHFHKLSNQWHSLKQKKRSHNALWSFKSNGRLRSKNEVYEGYALVDQDKNIIDYVIVDSYKREQRTSHLLH